MNLHEIDYLCAKHIMEWEMIDDPDSDFYGCWIQSPGFADYFHPTRDIADAWKLVEKLDSEIPTSRGDLGQSVRFRWFSVESGLDCWEAGIKYHIPYEGDAFDSDCSAIAQTASLAICLAALKARGIQIPT